MVFRFYFYDHKLTSPELCREYTGIQNILYLLFIYTWFLFCFLKNTKRSLVVMSPERFWEPKNVSWL